MVGLQFDHGARRDGDKRGEGRLCAGLWCPGALGPKDTSMSSIMPLFVVSLIWGSTNALMKWFSKDHAILYTLSFLANLMGSVLYYKSLQDINMSVASLLTNALTLVVTLLVVYWCSRRSALHQGRLQESHPFSWAPISPPSNNHRTNSLR